MCGLAVHERLRQKRLERGDDLEVIAKRTGVREGLLRAIEQGRFSDLPRGIYGRAAIRTFAAEVGLDPMEVLADCDALLVPIDDQVDALARLRGVRQAPRPSVPAEAAVQPTNEPFFVWRPLAAAAIDGAIITGLLGVLLLVTMIFCGAPPSAFQRMAAPAFGLMGILLAGCYFICFAGIAGATVGERVTGISLGPDAGDLRDGHAVLTRAFRGVVRDATCIRTLGDTVGRVGGAWHARMQTPTTPA